MNRTILASTSSPRPAHGDENEAVNSGFAATFYDRNLLSIALEGLRDGAAAAKERRAALLARPTSPTKYAGPLVPGQTLICRTCAGLTGSCPCTVAAASQVTATTNSLALLHFVAVQF